MLRKQWSHYQINVTFLNKVKVRIFIGAEEEEEEFQPTTTNEEVMNAILKISLETALAIQKTS